MSPNINNILSMALNFRKGRVPIWFLRQAGRYLPEYQKIRSQMSFLELCKNPKKAAEVTLQPIHRFDIDAAIIFSDILIVPTALGQNLEFKKDHGPLLHPVIRDEKDLDALNNSNSLGQLNFVGEALSIVKNSLSKDKALIGFAGAPMTVASYMIEGQGTKTFTYTKKLAFEHGDVFQSLLEKISRLTEKYLEMQVQAGADTIMLFDSWAGHFSRRDYQEYVLPQTKSLFQSLSRLGVPVIYYSGIGSENINFVDEISCDIIHVDWRTPMSEVTHFIENAEEKQLVLQGNLDPMILTCHDEHFVRGRVNEILESAFMNHQLSGYIFNVGHGLLPITNVQSVEWAIDEVRQYSAKKS